MKAVILAGGLGTRIAEETRIVPKPMIEIGGKPIIWHIMKVYSAHGINDFIICCGYKGYVIKEYFANYALHMSDVTFDVATNQMAIHQNHAEPWTVTVVDTGEHTMTGGRLKRIYDYVKDEELFCCTYGDGVGDMDISSLIQFHRVHGKQVTLTATQPPGRYGVVKIDSRGHVESFTEKPEGDGSWINGGFFVINPVALTRIVGDASSWESEGLLGLALDGELAAFKHFGFWQPMDTLRDKQSLNNLWETNKAPWKIW
ncbi:MAG: glucose-1-phosphate cytidylyltransferase [Luminiphilus sp.]|nr:glucose-1-phosphate cytidylyltransferase [Luminiphilus sp.]